MRNTTNEPHQRLILGNIIYLSQNTISKAERQGVLRLWLTLHFIYCATRH
jgi:hypothetical protein